ncbi:PAS domain-containing protein [Sphingomicrobium arenosum]|uniref:PAS domain-containing protein n=1 Tax=Sphingomicrobium arenosum TaxID=2233861 RepID=UPI002240EF21|nr:PAS domain-containing protein [Sphingomicrobium arenosum]
MSGLPRGLMDYMEQSTLSLSAAPVAVEDHPLAGVNEAFCKLVGYPREKVLGQNCRFLQGDRREQPGLAKLRTFLAGKGRGQCRVNLLNYRAEGAPFVNMLTLSRICDTDGNDCFLFASQFDIGAASEDEAERFDAHYRSATDKVRAALDPHEMMLVGSVAALANAASAIAEARMLVEHIDNGTRLY